MINTITEHIHKPNNIDSSEEDISESSKSEEDEANESDYETISEESIHSNSPKHKKPTKKPSKYKLQNKYKKVITLKPKDNSDSESDDSGSDHSY